jgi:hypothetical protein
VESLPSTAPALPSPGWGRNSEVTASMRNRNYCLDLNEDVYIIQIDREGVGEASTMEDRVETIIRLNIEHYSLEHYIARLNIDHYIARLNIGHYKKLLETDIDETKREIVMRLLAKEQANLLEVISKAKARSQTTKDLIQYQLLPVS